MCVASSSRAMPENEKPPALYRPPIVRFLGLTFWGRYNEFDAFYHFELSELVQKKVNEILGVQIFTTTHNTDLMSNDLLRPDCYFLLKDNSIRAISELTEKELRQAHNL